MKYSRYGFFFTIAICSLLLASSSVDAQNFIGPSSGAGVGQGAISVDSSYNLAIGTSTPQSDTKLLIVGTSTGNSYFAIKVVNNNTQPIFIVRSDGSVSIGSPFIQNNQSGATTTIPGIGAAPANGGLFVNGPIFTTLDLKAGGISVGTTTPQSGGNIYATGNITGGSISGAFSGTIVAGNVSAGAFGSNTGGGNYSFPASVGVGTSTSATLFTVATTTNIFNVLSNGRVGIGLIAPSQKLEIAGNVSSSGMCLGGVCNSVWPAGAGSVSTSSAITANYFPYWTTATGSLNGTSTIYQSGVNIGIGTAAPRSKFDVTVGTANIAGNTSDVANFTGANATIASNNGNISVNTTNAQAAGFGGSIVLGGLWRAASNDNATFAQIRGSKLNSTDANYSGYLAFSTRNNGSNLAETMRIDNLGNVGIGTVSPAAKLAINGGLHVGGDSDPGDNNALVDGTLAVDGASVTAKNYSIRTTGVSSGAAATAETIVTQIDNMQDATPTTVLTVTIPNGAHSAGIDISAICSMGAGGAIGAHESAYARQWLMVVTRTAGLNTATSTIGGATAAGIDPVVGSPGLNVAASQGPLSGTASDTQTLPFKLSAIRLGGSSNNHSCTVSARIINQAASGITIN